MLTQLYVQGATIVLRGPFSPAIFHPMWFAAHDLIRSQEAEAAKVQIIHPDAAAFTAEWLQLNVTQDSFQAGTSQEAYYEALRDLVIGVLNLLSHTPLRVMGLNHDFHFGLPSEDTWHSVGHRLAPKRDWEDVLQQPGMLSLTMEGKRPDHLEGYIRVKVEPSARAEYGVYVEVNDHYQLKSDDARAETRDAVQILAEQWAASIQRSKSIAEKIVSLGEVK